MNKLRRSFSALPLLAAILSFALLASGCVKTPDPAVSSGGSPSGDQSAVSAVATDDPVPTGASSTETAGTPTLLPTTGPATLPTVGTTTPTDPATTTDPVNPTVTPTPSVAVTGVRLDRSVSSLTVGDVFTVSATVLPENASDRRVSWSVSDPAVLSLDGGTLTAKSAGSAVVTVTTADGSFSASFGVTVNPASTIPNAFRYDENGLPTYTPTFEEGVEYYDFNPKNTYHLFCHNLVAFEDKDDYFFSDCITVTEFKRILEQLYERGYILIDADYMYEYSWKDGLINARIKDSIKLPKGKKAIILSVDNVAYPRGEHGKGRCDRLEVVDGKLMTYTKLPDGREFYSDDNEVFTILENFIAAHPDFSFSGAKCIVAPSGYEGLFGWDTIPGEENDRYEESVAECKKIVKWFNEHGYLFACHSYYHKNFNTMSQQQVAEDRARWMSECYPIVGRTHIFIYPFGAFTNPKEENGLANARLLNEAGYAVFCATSYYAVNWNNFPIEGNCYNERVTLASKLFTLYPDNATLAKLFDVYSVYDNDAHSTKLTK